jgi:hypothetical protein
MTGVIGHERDTLIGDGSIGLSPRNIGASGLSRISISTSLMPVRYELWSYSGHLPGACAVPHRRVWLAYPEKNSTSYFVTELPRLCTHVSGPCVLVIENAVKTTRLVYSL